MTDTLTHQPRNNVAPRPVETGFGSSQVGAADIEMPRLRLLQAMSQAVADEKGSPGTYFNSLDEDDYGSTVLFVPVIGFKNRVRLVMGEGLKCRSIDTLVGVGDPGIVCAECSFKDWPHDRRARGEDVPARLNSPECTISQNWVGLVVGKSKPSKKGADVEMETLEDPKMVVIQWRSTATAAAKKLNGFHFQARLTNRNLQWFDRTYRLGVDKTQNDRGTFFVPSVTPAGKTQAEHREWAENLALAIGERPIDATEQQEREEAPVPHSTGGTDDF